MVVEMVIATGLAIDVVGDQETGAKGHLVIGLIMEAAAMTENIVDLEEEVQVQVIVAVVVVAVIVKTRVSCHYLKESESFIIGIWYRLVWKECLQNR
jgi:hypothetical protein